DGGALEAGYLGRRGVVAGLVAGAAARLVRVVRADHDRLACERRGHPADEALRHRRGTAAAVADRLELVDELGQAEQCRQLAERAAAEVLREPRGDDARSPPDEGLDRVDDALVEELHLV